MIENVQLGNATFAVGFDTAWPHVVSASEQGWLIDQTHSWGLPFANGGTLYQENASSCTGNEFHKRRAFKRLKLDMGHDYLQIFLPSIEEGEQLYLKLAADTYIHCNREERKLTAFVVEEGRI